MCADRKQMRDDMSRDLHAHGCPKCHFISASSFDEINSDMIPWWYIRRSPHTGSRKLKWQPPSSWWNKYRRLCELRLGALGHWIPPSSGPLDFQGASIYMNAHVKLSEAKHCAFFAKCAWWPDEDPRTANWRSPEYINNNHYWILYDYCYIIYFIFCKNKNRIQIISTKYF